MLKKPGDAVWQPNWCLQEGSHHQTSDRPPSADEVRPIDVFSAVLRIHATIVVNLVRPWTLQVSHKEQHALVGGVLHACSNLAWATECASLGLQEVWGLSVDFAKMFNTLSPHIAFIVARTMGLSTNNVRDLALPIINACGVWRLPANYPPEMFASSRGLPQGMASSVLLAELETCPVLWRLTRHDPTMQVWSYADDLNLATQWRS